MPFILALVLSFFVGAIPFGYLIGKTRGVDLRAAGSGNIGATNTWRVLGPQAGTAAFVLDVLKGVAGVLISHKLVPGSDISNALCGIAAVVGHTFSPFLGFKGGKGIATSLGALLALMPMVGVVSLAIWAFILAKTRVVSLASVTACIALPFVAFAQYGFSLFFYVAILMGTLAFLKHIPNLKRIAKGTEPKIGQKPSVVV